MQLYPWQVSHAEKVLAALRQYGVVCDASDTGTGKTYIALWAAREYGHPVFIVCPKAVIPKWRTLAKEAGLNPIAILNVERLKRSKYIINCGAGHVVWNLQKGTLVIVDEAHQYGGLKTANARILWATRAARLPVMALSATLANSPLRLRALGFLLGLFPNWYGFWEWSLKHGAEEVIVYTRRNGTPSRVKTIQFVPEHAVAKEGVQKIHDAIFTAGKGYRLRSGESPGFPENHVVVECRVFDNTPEINKSYRELQRQLEQSGRLAITQNLMLRAHIEALRVPDLAEMVTDLAEERSVVVFLNFRKSIESLKVELGKASLAVSVIEGEQTEDEREASRTRFQNNEVRVCLCTYGAGGLGLDLHDLNGRPRISILNPTWSAVQTVQALGRIHRAGSRSPAVQKLVFASGTVEEEVATRVDTAMKNLSLLQDGDFMPVGGNLK